MYSHEIFLFQSLFLSLSSPSNLHMFFIIFLVPPYQSLSPSFISFVHLFILMYALIFLHHRIFSSTFFTQIQPILLLYFPKSPLHLFLSLPHLSLLFISHSLYLLLSFWVPSPSLSLSLSSLLISLSHPLSPSLSHPLSFSPLSIFHSPLRWSFVFLVH